MNKNSKWKMGCSTKSVISIFGAVLCTTVCQSNAYAADVQFDAGITGELVSQKVDAAGDDGDEGFDVTNRILRPFAAISLNGKRVDFRAQATNNYVNRNLNNESVSTNFPEYTFNGSYDAIENLLSFTASGAQRYQSQRLQSFVVDDFLLNQNNLNKISTSRFGSQFSLPRGDYFGFSLGGNYNKTESDLDRDQGEVGFANTQFDNEGYSASVRAITGESFIGFRSTIDGSVNYIKRGNNQNFRTQRLDFSNNVSLFNDFGLVANAFYENNELESDEVEDTGSGLREFYSAGAGLFWSPTANRYIEIAYNQSTTKGLNGQEDEENNFVSYQLNWALSTRTAIAGSYTRRFFGDSGNFSFRHNLRNWRSSITYQESVNSTSQLLTTNELGLFICPNGTTDFSQCSLTDTIEPDLQDGEVLRPLNIVGFDVNDRIILRKGLTAQTAVTRRRTTISFVASQNKLDEFEIDRNIDTSNVQTNVSFEFSSKTRATVSHSFSKVESLRDVDDSLKQITNQFSVEVSRELSRNFTTSLGLSYLERKGETDRFTNQFRGLNGALTDRRITLRVSYNFGSRR